MAAFLVDVGLTLGSSAVTVAVQQALTARRTRHKDARQAAEKTRDTLAVASTALAVVQAQVDMLTHQYDELAHELRANERNR